MSEQPTPPRRRWFRFRLRTLLIVVAILAIPLAWIAKERRQTQYEQNVADLLRDAGFKRIVHGGPYDSTMLLDQGQSQDWWRDAARHVLGERIRELGDPPHDFAETSKLSHLTCLISLDLANTQVIDIQSLSGLSNLAQLWLNSTEVNDLTPLNGLKNLGLLELSFTKVSDLRPLAGLSALRVLNLEYTSVSDLSPLVKLTELHRLYIYRTQVVDLAPVACMRRLDQLDVRGLPVTHNQVKMLHIAMPHCKINHDPFP